MTTRWPGLPRPPHVQAPRSRKSLRYPWPCATLADVEREIAQCPEWARSMFAVEYGGQLYGWNEATALLPRAVARAAPRPCPRCARVDALRADAERHGKRVLP